MRQRNYSEETAIAIDTEIKRIVTDGMQRAETILRENIDTLHRLAAALLDREILDAVEIDTIIRGDELPPVPKRGNGSAAPAGRQEPGTTGSSRTGT
jgi:cell division protease FtsH